MMPKLFFLSCQLREYRASVIVLVIAEKSKFLRKIVAAVVLNSSVIQIKFLVVESVIH
jgi:hypothetical protein